MSERSEEPAIADFLLVVGEHAIQVDVLEQDALVHRAAQRKLRRADRAAQRSTLDSATIAVNSRSLCEEAMEAVTAHGVVVVADQRAEVILLVKRVAIAVADDAAQALLQQLQQSP